MGKQEAQMWRGSIVILVVAIAGCGGSVAPGGDGIVATATPEPTARSTPLPLSLNCPSELGDFVDQLGELDSRLDVGLTFADYSTEVGDAKVAYDRIPIADLSLDCLNVGVDAEDALQAYLDAHTTWNECLFEDPDCTNDSISSELQAKWAEAADLIDKAQQALE